MKKNSLFGLVGSVLMLATLFVALGGVSALPLMHQQEVVAKVIKSERVCSGSGDCKYMVYTNHGVMKNTDFFWAWKWNSSDVYAKIQRGKTYRFHIAGWRVSFLSMYPNILSVTPARS